MHTTRSTDGLPSWPHVHTGELALLVNSNTMHTDCLVLTLVAVSSEARQAGNGLAIAISGTVHLMMIVGLLLYIAAGGAWSPRYSFSPKTPLTCLPCGRPYP
jgi:hypothetical protein